MEEPQTTEVIPEKVETPENVEVSTPSDENSAPVASSEPVKETKPTQSAPFQNKRPPFGGNRNGGGNGSRPPFNRGGKPNFVRKEIEKPEYDQKMLSIRRVTRVMAGGRRMSFSVALALGNKNGVIGLGVGKANDTTLAIQKAVNDAKKNLIKVTLDSLHSIPFAIDAKVKAARIMLMPNKGKGLVSGSSLRSLLELGGVQHVTSKVLSRSRNKLNNARALMKALEIISVPYTEKPKPIVSEAFVQQ
jgi:small subunit ribosomal protein S5